MRSIIFSAMAQVLFWLMLAVSLLILWRGHNQPGGGFVGGLIAAMAVGVIALADGVRKARKLLPLHPIQVIGLGVLLALLSGVPALFFGESFLQHQWITLGSDFKVGTPLVFDLGVYLVVLGGMVSLIFRLYEEAP